MIDLWLILSNVLAMRFLRFIRGLKSHWFYWHTGQIRIALVSMAASALLSGLVLTLGTGGSLWSILLVVLLDAASLLLAVLYVIVLRWHLPDGLGVQSSVDMLALHYLILPAVVGVILNRGCAYVVARRLGYPFDTQTAPPRGLDA